MKQNAFIFLNILTPEKDGRTMKMVEQYNTAYLVTAFIKSLIF